LAIRTSDSTPADEIRHPVFARIFSAGSTWLTEIEKEDRRVLAEGLAGRVIEVGCGAGVNFAFYPPEVTEVVAVEPEAHFRGEATKAAAKVDVPVRVVPGVAERLPAENGEFDAAVLSLVMCSVQDPATALAEVSRVLRPGGQLHFYEHVAARGGVLRAIQHGMDATLWPLVAGGCHCGRDTANAIRDAGFEMVSLRHLAVKPFGIPSHLAPHILGVAARP
jgi:ubiquinone/menaquinone biosynthesis C-methylase UbiE